jgi:hypothetical protein
MRALRWTGSRPAVWAAALSAVLMVTGTAAAQPAPPAPPAGPRPWAQGVSPENQKAALVLFNEGNALLRDSIFPKAAEKYREALTHWDHPAIHYNLALALVNLDQPIEMYQALEKAMQYGPDPIDTDKFDRAKSLKITVEKTLANVEYTVEVEGAVLVFDGKEVFTGPGTWNQLITAGEHSVSVRAEGYVTTQFSTKIVGGEHAKRTIELFTEKQLLVEKRLMPAWLPFTIGGLGAVIGGGGFLLHQNAKTTFAEYDLGVRDCAAMDPTGGCTMPPAGLFDKKASAENKQAIAIGAYAVGGAALVAGAFLVVLNRPTYVRMKPRSQETDDDGVSLRPVISPGLTGLAASGHF